MDKLGQVWVLEDSPLERRLIAEAIGHRCDLTMFTEGEALTYTAPSVLVVDWLLPGISGLEVSRFVRESRDKLELPLGGGLPIVIGELDLAVLCEHIIDELTIANATREIAFRASGDLCVRGDRERLQQAISNLLGNALEHSSGPVTLEVTGRPTTIVVAVHNGGAGISAADLPVLFEPFRKREGQRTGLGLCLYIVREVATAHSGTVGVTSVPNGQTTFTITLPRAQPAPTSDVSSRLSEIQ